MVWPNDLFRYAMDVRFAHIMIAAHPPRTLVPNAHHKVSQQHLTPMIDMTELRPRAKRFEIKAHIRYREVGRTSWFEGTTENISGSGLLFRADHVLRLKTPVQMSFSLPASMNSLGSARVHCQGFIVRTAPTAEPNVTAIAAVIRSYRLVRQRHDA